MRQNTIEALNALMVDAGNLAQRVVNSGLDRRTYCSDTIPTNLKTSGGVVGAEYAVFDPRVGEFEKLEKLTVVDIESGVEGVSGRLHLTHTQNYECERAKRTVDKIVCGDDGSIVRTRSSWERVSFRRKGTPEVTYFSFFEPRIPEIVWREAEGQDLDTAHVLRASLFVENLGQVIDQHLAVNGG